MKEMPDFSMTAVEGLLTLMVLFYAGAAIMALKTYRMSHSPLGFGLMAFGASVANIPLWLIFLFGVLHLFGLAAAFTISSLLSILFLIGPLSTFLGNLAYFLMVRGVFRRAQDQSRSTSPQ